MFSSSTIEIQTKKVIKSEKFTWMHLFLDAFRQMCLVEMQYFESSRALTRWRMSCATDLYSLLQIVLPKSDKGKSDKTWLKSLIKEDETFLCISVTIKGRLCHIPKQTRKCATKNASFKNANHEHDFLVNDLIAARTWFVYWTRKFGTEAVRNKPLGKLYHCLSHQNIDKYGNFYVSTHFILSAQNILTFYEGIGL